MKNIDIQVIFENDDVLVINKPAGLIVHPACASGEDDHNEGGTVVDWFLKRVLEARGIGEEQLSRNGKPLERSGIVHRLDRETSGVLVLVKTQAAFEHLKSQFHDRHIKKEYRAFVYGHMNEKWGTIDRPIGRSTKDFRLRSAQRGAKGTLREATTDWELIGQGKYKNEQFAYLKLLPKTGRTHQLRTHLKAINRPIVGDKLYAGKKREQSNNLGFNRLALHAYILELTLPDGESKLFTSPLPTEFKTAANNIVGG